MTAESFAFGGAVMRIRYAVMAVVCPVVVDLSMPGAAQADQADLSSVRASGGLQAKVGMQRVGFDAGVARANGYEIRKTADGRQYGVRPGTPQTQGYAEVYGDCGMSYIRYEGRGGGSTETVTGFEVRNVVAAGQWEVDIIDQGGVRVIPFNVTPGRNYWDGFSLQQNQTRGSSSAEVDPGFSEVVLVDGSVCVSGGPATFTNIY